MRSAAKQLDNNVSPRHYVHCINEWVSAGPSNIRLECLDSVTDLTSIPGIVPKGQEFTDRIQQLSDQQKKDLEIDPRHLTIDNL